MDAEIDSRAYRLDRRSSARATQASRLGDHGLHRLAHETLGATKASPMHRARLTALGRADRLKQSAEPARSLVPRVRFDHPLATRSKRSPQGFIENDALDRIRPHGLFQWQEQGTGARDLAQGRDVAGHHRTVSCHSLERRKAKPFVERREEKRQRSCVEATDLCIVRLRNDVDSLRSPCRSDRVLDGAESVERTPREDEISTHVGPIVRPYEKWNVLARGQAPDEEEIRSARMEDPMPAVIRPNIRCDVYEAWPRMDDRDSCRIDTEVTDELLFCKLRYGNDCRGARQAPGIQT